MLRPASFADLEAWSVYADWLQGHGDPRGELIAFDLALPVEPTNAELKAFKARYQRIVHARDTLHVGHTLAHAREVSLPETYVRMGGREPPTVAVLVNLAELLRGETYGLVERLHLVYAPGEDGPWRRLFAAIPASCSCVSLDLLGYFDDDELRHVFELLPAHVRDIAISRAVANSDAAMFVDDRFDTVQVRAATADVLVQFARTQRVRLLVREGVIPVDARIGYAGLASMRGSHRARAFQPWGALVLEHHYGPVPVRAQLSGTLAEWHQFSEFDVVRRGPTWTFRSHLRYRHQERPCEPSSIVKLADGDVLEVGEQRYVFALHPRV